jgi:hypothetical protein
MLNPSANSASQMSGSMMIIASILGGMAAGPIMQMVQSVNDDFFNDGFEGNGEILRIMNMRVSRKAQEQLKQVVDTEKRKSAKVHNPDANLNQQALDRVLAEGRMYQMEVELRELLIYQSPPELGDLYTRFNKMRQTIQQEQEQARREQDRKERIAQAKRQKMIDTIQEDIIYVFVVLFVCLVMGFMFWLIVEERKIRWGF